MQIQQQQVIEGFLQATHEAAMAAVAAACAHAGAHTWCMHPLGQSDGCQGLLMH